jgi:hypothetical protein
MGFAALNPSYACYNWQAFFETRALVEALRITVTAASIIDEAGRDHRL